MINVYFALFSRFSTCGRPVAERGSYRPAFRVAEQFLANIGIIQITHGQLVHTIVGSEYGLLNCSMVNAPSLIGQVV